MFSLQFAPVHDRHSVELQGEDQREPVGQEEYQAFLDVSCLPLLDKGFISCREANMVAIDLITTHIQQKLQQPDLR